MQCRAHHCTHNVVIDSGLSDVPRKFVMSIVVPPHIVADRRLQVGVKHKGDADAEQANALRYFATFFNGEASAQCPRGKT